MTTNDILFFALSNSSSPLIILLCVEKIFAMEVSTYFSVANVIILSELFGNISEGAVSYLCNINFIVFLQPGKTN